MAVAVGRRLYSDSIAGRWRQRSNERIRTVQPFADWSIEIPEAQAGPLDFVRFPYQSEPYAITSDLPEVTVCKGTQVGFSTWTLRWAMWVADELSGTVMYVFPTKDLVYDFSDQRVLPLIQGSEKLRARVAPDDPQNKGLKKLGRGYVYFRGSKKVTDLDSVPATALVLDEYDELAQKNIPVAMRRVGAAENPMIRRIGVPTLQNYGIEREYRSTDMRRWLVKCSACGEWQRVTWENVRWKELAPDEYRAWRVCVGCERPIDVGRGEWVAEHPERSKRGYHVPRLVVPRTDLGAMVKARLSEREEEREAHYNRDLAEPFETPDQRLAVAAIESCKREAIRLAESYIGFNVVTMGIDVSSTRGIHVRISEHLNEKEKRVLWVGVIDAVVNPGPEQADESALRVLHRMMDVYNVRMAAIDHLPDGIFARAFCAAHRGRAVMVAYNASHRARHQITFPSADEPDQLVVVARTPWITMTLDRFRWQRNLLPLRDPLPKGQEGKTYEEHLRAVVKRRQTDTDGVEFYAYESTGPDDFLQCEVYDEVALRAFQQRTMEAAVTAATSGGQEVRPPDPTPDLSDWEGRPWNEDAKHPWESTYGEGWDDDGLTYRP